jgi:hypothetical protein
MDTQQQAGSVDLFWLPLGAGSGCVRHSGRTYEALAARYGHRRPQKLFHSALHVRAGADSFVVEMTPAWGRNPAERGVVCEGAVGSRLLRRSRLFRYEVRRWRGGEVGDVADALGGSRRLSSDPDRAHRMLELVAHVPPATWGRDEQHLGDMWNSNSLVSWLLARTGHDMSTLAPPQGGRAPGWSAGLALAERHAVESRLGLDTWTSPSVARA